MTWDGDATARREMRAWKHGADADERPAGAIEGARHTAMVEAGRDVILPSADIIAAQLVEMQRDRPAVVRELAALRAAVALLEAEVATARAGHALADDAAAAASARLAAVEVERDAARAALAGLIADVEPFAAYGLWGEHAPEEWDRVPDGLRRAVARARAAMEAGPRGHPPIVCLCGSTRFFPAFMAANYRETMAGAIVLSVGFYPHAEAEMHGERVGITPAQKAALDELHLRKVELADEILVLNVGGYIGESTARELAHARALGKRVRFLEPEGGPGSGDGER